MWDVASGQELFTLTGHGGVGEEMSQWVNGIAFSPDGSRLVTAGGDGTAKIWDAASGEELFTLSGHSAALETAIFSPDGTSLATGSWDATTKLWDVETGDELLTLAGHANGVIDADFSPDGRFLATSSGDRTVRFYVLDLEELLALAQSRVTRSLTDEECQQYLHVDQCPAMP
jgi:WD40 repeat protein